MKEPENRRGMTESPVGVPNRGSLGGQQASGSDR